MRSSTASYSSMSTSALILGLVALLQASPASSSSSPKTICSPNSCSSLPSSSPSFSLGAYTPSGLLLLPGTYVSSALPAELTVNSSSSSPLAGLEAYTNYTLSTRASPFDINPNQGVIFYDHGRWAGEGPAQFVPVGGEGNVTAARSAVLGTSVWAKVVVGGEQKVIRSSVRDFEQAPFGLKSKKGEGKIEVIDVQSSLCSSACSSGGSCVAVGTTASCVCKAGFEGDACERCATGYFGKDCSPCASSCASGQCDDGLTGSGVCEVSSKNSTVACNCLSGACVLTKSDPNFLFSSPTTCKCSPGFTTPPLSTSFPAYSTSHLQCSLCSSGYYSTSTRECLACTTGAKECKDAATPTSCITGFELDGGKCVSSTGPSGKGSKCSGSNWWNSEASSCQPCSPLCGTCSGSSSTMCLTCPSGKAILNSVCVDVDPSTGECDSSTINAGRADNAGWFFDNTKKQCDTCPPKTTGCSFPSFNSTSSRSDLIATGCTNGLVVSLAGQCVPACPAGQFANDASEGKCQACDSECGTCAGYASFCTSCASTSNVALGGSCLQTSCPTGTTLVEGQCVTCHGDCKTCSGASFDQCSACPSDRPLLDNGRCLPVCKSGQFLDPSTSSCVACDASCSECIGPGQGNCLSCSTSDHIPLLGACVSSNCTSTLVPSLQICLADLLTPASSSSHTHFPWWAILLVLLVVLALVGAGAVWYVRREREKTRQATLRFAHGLDEVKVQRKVWEVGVENVLGLMGRAREGMETRWKGRGGVRLGEGAGARGLKPFKLGTGWQHVGGARVDEEGGDEFDMVLARSSTIRRDGGHQQQQQQPPPYSPSSSLNDDDDDDTESVNFAETPKVDHFPARWRAIRTSHHSTTSLQSSSHSHSHSHSDEGDLVPPSPPYTHTHASSIPSHTSFSSTSTNVTYPTLTRLQPSVARPSLFKTRLSSGHPPPPPQMPQPQTPYTAASSASSFNSWEPSVARETGRDRTVNTDLAPFPDFQSEYSTSRGYPAIPTRGNEGGTVFSRFVEEEDGEASSDEGHEGGERERERERERGSYWLTSVGSEGGRTEEGVVEFAPAGPGKGMGMGSRNPFRQAERKETMWI